MKKFICQSVVVLIFAITSVSCSVQKEIKQKNALIGTWQFCTPNGEVISNRYGKDNHVTYKMISDKKFTVIDLQTEQRKVLNSFVGSYTVEKDMFTEFVQFASIGYKRHIAKKHSYNFSIKGDLLTIEGIDN
ncbi:MAG: hypothetical protein JKX79_10600, partial [Labilibaculum sp.]|nr:hypothetical protein [Labilibaculum sp.]